jgi:hypothetical protein
MSLPSSGSKKIRAKIFSSCHLLHDGFLLGLFYDPEDRGDMFPQNIGWFSMDYMALYPRRYNPS